MDRNYITGMVLLFVLFVVWYKINAPNAEELQQQQFVQDSIEQARSRDIKPIEEAKPAPRQLSPVEDSLQRAQMKSAFMGFQVAESDQKDYAIIENDVLRITFDKNGGQIREVLLKEYDVLTEDSLHNELRYPVTLMDHPDNSFGYQIPMSNGGVLNTAKLFHKVKKNGKNDITLTATSEAGGQIAQTFKLTDGSYTLDYDVSFENMGSITSSQAESVKLEWRNHHNKLEKNVDFEKMYSTVYYHETEEGTDYCSCRGDDQQEITNRLKWVSHANQFFSSNLIAEAQFLNGEFETIATDETDPVLKKLNTTLTLPISNFDNGNFDMQFYIGPNDFDRLGEIGNDLTDIVPFGWSIFGSINRWIIRPLFKFLSSYIGNMGIVILILTFIVKACVFPLTYKMLHSQSKMAALKPVTAGIKEKYKDDMQKSQMESMKVYREYGVNPMGGCFPMVLQMPIWFALYRFFPASIEFRQASFLWAPDLSTFDSFFNLPFDIPMMGSHISLFTLLWVISLIAYTWYNMKHNLDMSTAMNPMMKNMQFIMPVMFFVFLNQYAAGLTCYLLFSNLFNIGQTIGTKNFLINEDKIKEQLRANKAKPKKKGGFQQRITKALEEQKKQAEEIKKKPNRKR